LIIDMGDELQGLAMRHWAKVCGFLALCMTVFGSADPVRAAGGRWLTPGPAYAAAAPSGGFWESFFGAGAARATRPARPAERRALPSGSVSVHVSLGSQRMTVSVGGEVLYSWPISSGRIGYSTPHGTYHPQRLAVMWRSHRFHMSPMPHSIFFRGGYAIHGTYATAYLGARASHGCIRLSPGNAAALFSLVRNAGFGRTRITITG
jgi:hypothetical protein